MLGLRLLEGVDLAAPPRPSWACPVGRRPAGAPPTGSWGEGGWRSTGGRLRVPPRGAGLDRRGGGALF